MVASRDSQEGESEKAAVGRLKRLSENFHSIYVECGMLNTALRIRFGAYGQAHFKASTPCAIESEVSDVQWTRSEDAVPSVKSEYWSAGAG